ncbi:hypothetical protein FRACA_3000005 [Frankia canadensis]|uniref:Uncharacterized protein n=1 Tax=Frankia canadensis TaxID=1836972 RepID=A0A2I2KU49_9ACTN|nr:hypothetical protein FRACA_3000005 [Frankia canadensis]SOU56459.1 hypothetical protein FRACA_3000005 [Frankia canadensis]
MTIPAAAKHRLGRPTLAMLPRVADSLSFLYLESVRIFQDGTGVLAHVASPPCPATRHGRPAGQCLLPALRPETRRSPLPPQLRSGETGQPGHGQPRPVRRQCLPLRRRPAGTRRPAEW